MYNQKRVYIFRDLATSESWFHYDDDWILRYCNFKPYRNNIHPLKLRLGQKTEVISNFGHITEISYKREERQGAIILDS